MNKISSRKNKESLGFMVCCLGLQVVVILLSFSCKFILSVAEGQTASSGNSMVRCPNGDLKRLILFAGYISCTEKRKSKEIKMAFPIYYELISQSVHYLLNPFKSKKSWF